MGAALACQTLYDRSWREAVVHQKADLRNVANCEVETRSFGPASCRTSWTESAGARLINQDFAMRSRAALKPDTKRANVSDVTPRGSITSIRENCPRRATARSRAAASSRRA